MIKINLVPQRKVKRASEPGMKDVWIGAGALVAAIVAVVGLLHIPKQRELSKLREANETLQGELAALRASLKGFDELKKAAEAATVRAAAIETLLAAKIVPAYVLHELGLILTPGKPPTMTAEMTRRTDSDPNRRLDPAWDPKHVWIISFVDKEGTFKLEGGAQSDGDVNQFAKRLQASVYFAEVTPMRSERVIEQGSNISYNRFTITGKLVY